MSAHHRDGIEAIGRQIDQHLAEILTALDPEDGSELDTAIYTVKSFCEVAVRLMLKSSPQQVAAASRFVEIKARMHGVPVIREPVL